MSERMETGWRSGKLGELLPIKYGKSLPDRLRDASGTVPVFGSSGRVGAHSEALTRGPALIVGRKGSVGSVYYSDVPCWPIDTVYYSEAADGQNLRYFKYLLDSLRLVQLDKSTAVPGLSRDDYNALSVTIAPPDEQQRIVAEIEKQFSRLDEAVANLKRVKTNLKRYKAAVLDAAVEGRLVPTEAELARREGRSYKTGAELLRSIFECRSHAEARNNHITPIDAASLSHVPEGWVWANCDAAITSIEAGASFKCIERPPMHGETGVLKVSAVSWGVFDENESKTCSDPSRIEERYLVQPGDFLFSRANTIDLVGACVIVAAVTKQLMLSDKTLRFRIAEQVLPTWLLVFLRSRLGRTEIERLSTGNQESMRNIGQERIRQIRMPLPPLHEQRRIVAEAERRLSLVNALEAAIAHELQRAATFRLAILSLSYLS